MFSNSRWNHPRVWRACVLGMLLAAGLRVLSVVSLAQGEAEKVGGAQSGTVLTSFEEIWALNAVEQQQWHRVRLNFLVHYYDSLWRGMWGRCGESYSYISLLTDELPIKPGHRILVEGLMKPADALRIKDPVVTVLDEGVPLPAISTKGEVKNVERFNKRLVTVEGYVDREMPRDLNHLEISLITEGRVVQVQLLTRGESVIPQLEGQFIRAKGVYYAAEDVARGTMKIEIWVQQRSDIEVLGALDLDPRFDLPATELGELAGKPEDALVRVSGTVRGQVPGESLTIGDDLTEVVLQTPQTIVVNAGQHVEAAGFPAEEGGARVLRQALVKPIQRVFTSIAEVWGLQEHERQGWGRLHLDTVVYYYDPAWKAMWASFGGERDYLPIEKSPYPIKAGQRVLIEGSILLSRSPILDRAKVTVLEESVPIPALSTQGAIRDTAKFHKHMVLVEGYVDRQTRAYDSHVQLDLAVEGRTVVGRLLVTENGTVPNWEGAKLRIKGVYSATQDPTGAAPTIEVWISGVENIELLGSLETDERFEIPLTAIERLPDVPAGTLVRILGAGRAQQRGRSLTIRDQSGQVTLDTPQTLAIPLGQAVEAVGYTMQGGAGWTLRDAIFRRSKEAPPPPSDGLPRLRLADQLRELSAEEAAQSYPVQLSGLVTWARPDADFFFILDASGGVCIFRPDGFNDPLVLGTKVDVTGVSAAGKFTPVVLASEVILSSLVELPEPRPVTLEQALTGIEEGQWVSMTGYVRSVVRDGASMRLELTTSGGEFQAIVPPRQRWDRLPGSVVRVRGVCNAVANSKRQLTGIQMWASSSGNVQVEEAAPENPFAVEARPIASLRQFGSMQRLNRRVRVSGVVVHHEPGRLVHIQEGTEGLMVLSRDTSRLAPGDRIEAVGFPGRENSRVVLREAVYRRTTMGTEPAPVPVSDFETIDPELDGRLVRVEATLLDIGSHEGGIELITQKGTMVFEARLLAAEQVAKDLWVPGSLVALTGVYQIEFDEYRRPHELSLQLRSAEDVEVLRQPSWWTVRRVVAIAGMLGVAVVLGWGWAIALRRRVHEQTGVIREQLEKEKAARLEAALARASKLESLGVLAGGIAHDFNNLLTVIIGNVSLARLDSRMEAETAHCLTESERAALRARDLTQQLLTFAKGGAPMRMATRLPDLVKEAAHFALHGAKVRSDFDIAPNLWPADVDKGQIGQVVHNIIINAAQAMPGGGMIHTILRNEEIAVDRPNLPAGRYVKLSFTDTGTGISPEHVSRIFDPYFTTKKLGSGLGLATVYSIVKKHQGHIEVLSKMGRGTTFHVWLPAAANGAAAGEPGQTAGELKTGRVLLMDDEESIRQLCGAVLKRMGLEVTAVSDGASAVSEYASAIAAGRPFDLVILDLTVPGGMGGAEAMERLRDMDSGVVAIVSSGYSSDPVMADFATYGFRARVPKPYTAENLIGVVEKLMREADRSTVGLNVSGTAFLG